MNAVQKTGIGAYIPLPEGSAQYPPEFIKAHGVIKLREGAALVEIGVTEKTGAGIKNTLRNFHRKPAHFVPLDRVELSAYLGAKFGEADSAEKFECPPYQ
ncbi:MAG: hypothetical protein LBG76_03900 [Treponema sp.]|nr:hypothetical protein [Treponema sp.]